MGSSGVGDEPQYVVAKYDYIAQGNQVKLIERKLNSFWSWFNCDHYVI